MGANVGSNVGSSKVGSTGGSNGGWGITNMGNNVTLTLTACFLLTAFSLLTSPFDSVTLFVVKPHLTRSCCCWAAIFSNTIDALGTEDEER